MIKPADDYFHPRNDDPHWNESGWFGFNVPERKINGWLYMYHRPNMNYTLGGVAVWDPSGEQTWDCLFHDWHHTMALEPGANMFDFKAENSLTVECVRPLQQFRFGYDAEGCQLELEWNAFMEPPAHSGLASIAKDWGGGHFEQGGRMKGRVILDSLGGEELEINCWSNRDHSWGPRRITPQTPRGDFPWAIASENHAFHLTVRGELDPADDPVDGSVESILCGWYMRDGEVAAVNSGTRRCVERGADGRPIRVVLEATDSLGREFKAEGKCVNWLHWPGYPHYFQWWSLAEWQFDGVTAWGDISDWYPTHQSRRWLRNRKNVAVG